MYDMIVIEARCASFRTDDPFPHSCRGGVTMATHAGVALHRGAGLTRSDITQITWFMAGLVFTFLVPFLFSSVLNLQHDLYLLVYFVAIALFLTAYVVETHTDVVDMWKRGWKLSLIIGAFAGAFVVMSVINRETATAHPSGLYFGFEMVWRGLLYGMFDALILTIFPGMVAFALVHRERDGMRRRIGFAALALVLVWTITATYHLGYAQYRTDGVSKPEVGNTVISVPMLVTVNPAGSVLAHASMHMAAVQHTYETTTLLPPKTTVPGK